MDNVQNRRKHGAYWIFFAKSGCKYPIPSGELLSINVAMVKCDDFKDMIIGTIHGELVTLNMSDSGEQDPLLEGVVSTMPLLC